MKPRTRWIVGILLSLSLLVCGLFAGTWIGGRFFVAAGSGLAGPVIALGYGVIGGVLGAALGLVMSIFTPGRKLSVIAVPVLLAGAIVVVIAVRGYLVSSAESEAQLLEAYENLPTFALTITYPETAEQPPFARFEADWAARQYVVTTSGDSPRRCSVAMTGPDAVDILTALRGVDAILFNEPAPCATSPGAVDHELSFRIDEVRPPNTEGHVEVTAACLTRAPALAAPRDAAIALVARNGVPDTCD